MILHGHNYYNGKGISRKVWSILWRMDSGTTTVVQGMAG